MIKRLLVLALAAIPFVAWATGKPKPPEVIEKVVRKDCRHCDRDRYGWLLLGVAATVVIYEARKAQATAAPTADGATVQFVYRF